MNWSWSKILLGAATLFLGAGIIRAFPIAAAIASFLLGWSARSRLLLTG